MAKNLLDTISGHTYEIDLGRHVNCGCGWKGAVDGVAEHLATVVRIWVMDLTGDEESQHDWREAADQVRPFSSTWSHPADAAVCSFVINTMGLK